MTLTIYHNPRCSKSRQTLEILRERGLQPQIIEYLKTPPAAAELRRLLGLLGLTAHQVVRRKDAAELGIDPDALDEDALIRRMAENPILIERPIVVSGGRAALGRPPEAVLSIL